MMKILIAVIAAVFVAAGFGGVMVGVADAAAPGDGLYGIDRAVENLRLQLTIGRQARMRLQQQFTLERLMEIQTLADRGEKQHLGEALRELSQSLVETGREANNAGAQATQVNELLQETFQKAQGNTKEKTKEKTKEAEVETNESAEEEEEESKPGAYCNGSKTDHPVAEKLAERYETTYEAIIDWFCKGYGFGEIELAYRISKESGESIEFVFEQRKSGMGWGEIMQYHKMIGKDKPPKEKKKP